MAKHYSVKYHNGDEIIHLDGCIQPGDMALCNSDLMGDDHLGWGMAKETTKKVNCKNCQSIFDHLQSVNKNEFSKISK